MPRVFAYCRVSTIDQTTENQVREIAGVGFAVAPSRTIAETVSDNVRDGQIAAQLMVYLLGVPKQAGSECAKN